MLNNALILSGGGARAAYQVGVLNAVNELLPPAAHNPFPIICGTSAGAMNALALATHTGSFFDAVDNLNDIWSELTTEKVFKSSWGDLTYGGLRLAGSLLRGGVGCKQSISLLDNSPLRKFLNRHIDFNQLEERLAQGDLKAVSICAMNYSTSESVNFFQSGKSINDWRRARRIGRRAQLNMDHLMASSAIPGIFPSTKIGADYYADGALRQVSPISPALHLGADRIFVVGVSGNRNPVHWGKAKIPVKHSPSIAQIFGHLFNSAFIDGLEGDLEHLERVNALLKLIPEKIRQDSKMNLKPAERMIISPTRELDKMAARNIRHMPKSVRFLMGATGASARGGGAATMSYLLFEKPYINDLIELGYQDVMWDRQKIIDFFAV